MTRYKVDWNDDEEKYEVSEEPAGCLIPFWLIILIALAGLGLGPDAKGETVGQLTCYDNWITGRQYCE